MCQAGVSENLGCQLRGEADADHPAYEITTRKSACFHRCNELSKLLVLHQKILPARLLRFVCFAPAPVFHWDARKRRRQYEESNR
jgi:hypothetical protein